MVSEKEIRLANQDVLTVETITRTLKRLRYSDVSHSQTISTVIRSLKSAMTKMDEAKVLARLAVALKRTRGGERFREKGFPL
jgi:hypothetical protein